MTLAYSIPQVAGAAWQPLPGSQTAFLLCPHKEICYEGTRGPGKTEAVLQKFLMHCNKGYENRWVGVIFRRRSKDLDDVEKKAIRLFKGIPNAPRYLRSKSDRKFVWPDGEELMLRHTEKPEQYDGFHGWEIPFIVWDELTTWHNSDLYESFKSVCRSSNPDMPRFYISLTNPYGVGHNWVKEYWIDPAPGVAPPTGIGIRSIDGEVRVRFHGDIRENPFLWENDPQYIKALMSIKDDNKRKAWLHGDWSIAMGGFFDGYWDAERHIIKPFEPSIEWIRWVAMDWGFAKPYSIGFYTMDQDGCIYRYNEMYGIKKDDVTGKDTANVGSRENAKAVAKTLKKRMTKDEKHGIVYRRNPADSAIWSGTGTEQTIQEEFRGQKVNFIKSIKGPNSRINGADICRRVLDEDMFKVTSNCKHWIRTVPTLMPDDDNPEDVDTDQEDHAYDEWRYSIVSRHRAAIKKVEEERAKPGTFDHLILTTSKKPNQTNKLIYKGLDN